jgi:hypothetical protein
MKNKSFYQKYNTLFHNQKMILDIGQITVNAGGQKCFEVRAVTDRERPYIDNLFSDCRVLENNFNPKHLLIIEK